MTIKEGVTKYLCEAQPPLEPYPGEELTLDIATLTRIAQDTYRAVVNTEAAKGAELMKMIDNELEARGYYAPSEKHDTPLVPGPEKAQPPASSPAAPSPAPTQTVEIMNLLTGALSDAASMKSRAMALEFQISKAIGIINGNIKI